MNENFKVFGDEVRIRVGKESEIFSLYLERYDNGLCTYIGGFNNKVELLKKLCEFMEKAPMKPEAEE